MSVIKLGLTINEDKASLRASLETPGSTSGRYSIIRSLLNRLEQSFSGGGHRASGDSAPSLTLAIDDYAVAASGTITHASVSANDTVTVNGVVFTAKSSGASGNEWNIGASNTTSAAAFVVAFNASASAKTNLLITATSALGVVTLTAIRTGLDGNAFTLVSSNGTRLAVTGSGYLASGAVDSSAVTLTA